MGREDKTDSGVQFDDDHVVAGASYYQFSTGIVPETQILTDHLMMMMTTNDHLLRSRVYSHSPIDQDSIIETNLADTPFQNRLPEESNVNGFRMKSGRRNGRTKYDSDSLLTMILRERSRANAEEAAARDASSLSEGGERGEGQQSPMAGSPPDYENYSFSGSGSPPSSGSSIQRSNSISQRSNSTASNSSFAFPVLASEWNGSPVRMAKADKRRRLKKTRWWGICFNCHKIYYECFD